ncbi:Tryptophan transporter TrpP [Peptoclostridium litorale DSM 5388]|uniref:Putative tryptophan transport protein TrpP n=1 Tax=Peptoclostridium litorale DSM 5388 TaxID=1121324 RepID=A0A069RCK9_PEPLI|nr:tryptophan transporter [Peptoclostridium litorale]KDR93980.1 putative tryptophan transport protein TrpP [Peptoclostridium litorale DSM 5388]SIN79024.1 Tryptophan transporter TrpP [Peptoclostridium litorale DSM 5388]
MNLKKNILTALLLAIGFILHQLVPGALGSMKFDIMLSVIFVSIFINSEFKNAVLTALLGGIITALTTTFPGGQLPNIIDKLVTCMVVFAMVKIAEKIKFNKISAGIIAFVGTIVSGSVFLYSALLIVGLPAPFGALFIGIVLPTAVTNIFVTVAVYGAVNMALKMSNFSLARQ